MSFFMALVVTGAILAATGLVFLAGGPRLAAPLQKGIRSQTLAVLLMGGAMVWFLLKIAHLGEADFGQYRQYIFLLFAAVGVASFFSLRDFLAVRGLAVLVLLCAQEVILKASFFQYGWPQLLLNGFTYLAIVAALWLGASPFRMRDFLEWLYRQPQRSFLLGAGLVAYGGTLMGAAFTL